MCHHRKYSKCCGASYKVRISIGVERNEFLTDPNSNKYSRESCSVWHARPPLARLYPSTLPALRISSGIKNDTKEVDDKRRKAGWFRVIPFSQRQYFALLSFQDNFSFRTCASLTSLNSLLCCCCFRGDGHSAVGKMKSASSKEFHLCFMSPSTPPSLPWVVCW